MIPVVPGDVADEPSSSSLGFLVVASFVQPDGRFGKDGKNRDPQTEEDELRVEGRSEGVGGGLG